MDGLLIMKDCCEHSPETVAFGKVLWVALALNFTMFIIEVGASFAADSVSLQADALDFFGDSANYAITLFVLHRSLQMRTGASLIKAYSMGGFAVWVLGHAIYNWYTGASPAVLTMGALGTLALAVNFLVAILLFKFRKGDSNAESVWLCTRNDVIGNIAVILAALGVYLTNSIWPDLLVAVLLGSLGFQSAIRVIRKVKQERLALLK